MEENRNQSTESWRSRETRLGAIFESTSVGFAMTDSFGRLIEANAAICKIVGYPMEDLLGAHFSILFHPDDRAENQGLIQQLVQGLISDIVVENRYIRQNGETVWVRKSISLSRGADPEQLSGVILIEDITEHKKADLLLQRNLEAMTKLHELGMRSVQEGNLETVLTEVLDAAILISRANFGNIQIIDPISGDLKIVAQRGFPEWWIAFWNSVTDSIGVCGTALERGERTIVEDVEQSPIFLNWQPGLDTMREVGVRAVQSTPLVSRTGEKAGVFSTHYLEPTRLDEHVQRLLDLLARQAADIIEQVQAEAALRESEGRFRLVFENSRDGINLLNLQTGQYTLMNPAQVALTGFTREEINGISAEEALERVHPDDLQITMEYQKMISAGKERGTIVEYRWKVKSGEYRWFSDSRNLVQDAQGNDVALIGISRDITGSKQAEAVRRESEERHRSLFEAIDEGVCFLERMPLRPDGRSDFRFVSMNPAMQTMLGVPDLSGRSVRDNFPDEVEAWYDDFERVLETGKALRFERASEPQGMVFEMLISRVERASGQNLLLVFEDVTSRKRREAQREFFLKLSESLKPLANPRAVARIACRLLVEFLDASRGQYTVVRGGPGEEKGSVQSEFIRRGQPLSRRFPLLAYGEGPLSVLRAGRVLVLNDVEKDPGLLEAEREIFLTVESPAAVSVPLIKENHLTALFTIHDNKPRNWTAEEIALIEETAEKTWAAVERARAERALRKMNEELEERVADRTNDLLASNLSLGLEIVERRQVEEELRQSKRSLEETLSELRTTQEQMLHRERLAAVGQLAAGVAHDFNNMLTGILSFTELLQLSKDTPANMQSNLANINLLTHRAAQLVRQLLDFSQKTVRHPEKFELHGMLQEHTAFLRRLIPENIIFSVNFETGHYWIEVDATQLQQVVTNLVVNARDALSGGGRLEVRLNSLTQAGQEQCSLCGEPISGDWFVLSVADSGEGIEPETLPHIFEPFFTTKEVGQGSGLGLSQVAGILAQNSGHLTVASQVNQGTTFSVYLTPISHREASQPEKTEPVLLKGQGQTILLVEDEPTVVEAIRNLLEYLHYEVITAENGREALALFRAHQGEIDLVLSDVVMPDIDGKALFQILSEEVPDLKMILMSGYPLGDNGADLFEAGVVAWLEKPITFGELSKALERALSIK